MEKHQDNTLHNYKFEVPEIIFGRGMLSQVGACARRLGGKKIFLVSDKGLFLPPSLRAHGPTWLNMPLPKMISGTSNL